MSKKQTKKPRMKIEIGYGVTLPERAIIDLIRLDCAGKILEMGRELANFLPPAMLKEQKTLTEVFAVTSVVLDIIQGTWKDELKKYTKTKTVCEKQKQVKSGLSETEKRKIRALRKQGLSVKAIGKEIHRAEKAVADFVRALTKK